MSITEQQLSAMIDAAVREAVERTAQQLTAKFESDTAGLRRNRDDLLSAKKTAEGKTPAPVTHNNFDEWLASLDERIGKLKVESARLTGTVEAQPASPVREHTITREQARNGPAYREAKAVAEKAGVPLRIVDENAPPKGRRSSPVGMIHDEVGGVLHANIRLVEKYGQQRMRQLAAEKGASLRAFRDANELPDEIAARHAEVIASGDRTNLL
jgi:hypothetical protein